MLKEKFIKEMKKYWSYTLFFSLLFCVFTGYKNLIQKEADLNSAKYTYAILEAMVLSKLILIGEALKVGERFKKRPLIVPTLYKTFMFSFFTLFFTVIEEFLLGYLKGKTFGEVYLKFVNIGLEEILGRVFVMSFVFILFFAFIELDSLLGSGTLFQVFFKKHKKIVD